MSRRSLLVALLMACAPALGAYNVSVARLPPSVGRTLGTSDFFLNLNPAYLQLPDGTPGLLVRTQNCSYPSVYRCPEQQWQFLTPSQLVLLKMTGTNSTTGAAVWEHASEHQLVFSANNVGPAAAYGTEDPRIVYREKDHTYYLTFAAASQPGVKEAYLATTQNPMNESAWLVRGKIADAPGGASIVIRDGAPGNGTHYMFLTDNGLSGSLKIATSPDLFTWTNTNQTLIAPRKGMWDAVGVAAGPSPVRLSDGNYLYLYNTDNQAQNPVYGRCALGWVVLDYGDPTRVLARAAEPLMVATAPYEKKGFTPNVIFATGLAATETPDTFVVYYGAADTVVASATVRVT
eukprot:gene1355-2097_t